MPLGKERTATPDDLEIILGGNHPEIFSQKIAGIKEILDAGDIAIIDILQESGQRANAIRGRIRGALIDLGFSTRDIHTKLVDKEGHSPNQYDKNGADDYYLFVSREKLTIEAISKYLLGTD